MPTWKVVTVYNPHAMYIAWGDKCFETRGWEPDSNTLRPGEILMIHAGTHRLTKRDKAFHTNPVSAIFTEIWKRQGITDLDTLPYGAIVAAAIFKGAHRVETLKDKLSVKERALGDYSPGRFAWELEVVRVAAKPIVAAGKQGIWRWSEGQ